MKMKMRDGEEVSGDVEIVEAEAHHVMARFLGASEQPGKRETARQIHVRLLQLQRANSVLAGTNGQGFSHLAWLVPLGYGES